MLGSSSQSDSKVQMSDNTVNLGYSDQVHAHRSIAIAGVIAVIRWKFYHFDNSGAQKTIA